MSEQPTQQTARQETFTKAYRGLRAQEWKRSMVVNGFCRYNGPGGMHCAVGWAFDVLDRYEGTPVYNLPGAALHNQHDTLGHVFLEDLQLAHDKAVNATDMQHKLFVFARKYGLEIPPDDGQDPLLQESRNG